VLGRSARLVGSWIWCRGHKLVAFLVGIPRIPSRSSGPGPTLSSGKHHDKGRHRSTTRYVTPQKEGGEIISSFQNDLTRRIFPRSNLPLYRLLTIPGAPFYIYSYYVVTNFLQDIQDQRVPALQSLRENNKKASEMLWLTMMQHWKLWPVVHSFNFYFVPIHHRVLVQVGYRET